MPRLRSLITSRRVLQIAAAVGLLLVILPVALTHSTRASAVLQDFLHGPVFSLVGLAVSHELQRRRATQHLPARWQSALALVIAALIGGVTELAQIPGPRDASVKDWLVDVVGAATALAASACFRSWKSNGRSPRLLMAAATLAGSAFLLAPATQAMFAYGNRWLRFPEVVGFRTMPLGSLDTYFLAGMSAHLSATLLPEPWRLAGDGSSLKVTLQPVMWPGIALEEPYPDWRGYSTLVVDLTNPQGHPLEFTLRIHDRNHNKQLDDRFNGVLTVAPNSRQVVRIPLSDVRRAPAGRSMDMEHIAGLILFRTGPEREDEVYITRMALEK